MKNAKTNITLFAGYKLVLQLTNVNVDSNGNIASAKAWTQFCDPLRSVFEYANGKWTVDEYSNNPDAVKLVEEMMQIQIDFDNQAISKEDAISQFSDKYGKWVAAHKKINAGFVEKQIIGLNKSGSKSKLCSDFFNFFKDVPGFQMSGRFFNTCVLQTLAGGREAAIQYVKGYLDLRGLQDEANEIIEKMGANKTLTPEWDDIEHMIFSLDQTQPIVNKRLKIYYGPAGTGKTTQAISELDNPGDVIVCNGAMDPNDLVFDFTFEDGKPTFKDGIFIKNAEEGKPILLDEINLLNDSVLRFLQGITDNKESFSIKDRTIHVKEGFMVIGTMNLSVNGQIYPMPDPLVDRAMEIREFTLDPSMLEQFID